MKEHCGYVVKNKGPRMVIQEPVENQWWNIEFTMKAFPHEYSRLRGHHCVISPGTQVRFYEEDSGQISDVWFDLEDIPNCPELSRIVTLPPSSKGQTAFAQRSCGCTVHACTKNVISDWAGVFEIGMDIWHESAFFRGFLEASNIEICLPDEKGVAGQQKK
jgi:hypothetical protein